MKQELAQLEEWHARADGHGIAIVGTSAAKFQKELKKACRARWDSKNDLENAQEENDACWKFVKDKFNSLEKEESQQATARLAFLFSGFQGGRKSRNPCMTLRPPLRSTWNG